jgi:hypothetical protein
MANSVIKGRLDRQDVIKFRRNRQDVTLYVPGTPGPGGDAGPTGTLLWDADFTGTNGTAPATADWTLFLGDTSADSAGGPPKATNHFVDGSGNLVLRSQREPAGYRGANNQYATAAFYSGAWLGTFGYGTGWPTTGTKKHVFTAPFAIEARAKYPTMPGGWGGLWMMPANKNNSTQGVVEIDWGEERLAVPNQFSGHQHWTGNDASGVKRLDNSASYAYDVPSVATELRDTWHTYRIEIFAAGTQAMRPRFYFDGVLRGTGPAIRNAPDGDGTLQTDVELGLMIDWRQAPAFRWGSGSTTQYVQGVNYPLDSDPGPWDLVVDYIRAYDLTGVTPP